MKAFISIDIGNQIVNLSSSAVIMQTQLGRVKVFSGEQMPLFRKEQAQKDKWLLITFILLGEWQSFCRVIGIKLLLEI